MSGSLVGVTDLRPARSMLMARGWAALLIGLFSIAACGQGGSALTVPRHAASPLAASPTPAASPSPVPSASPAAPQPLAIVTAPNGAIEAVTEEGDFLWAFQLSVLGFSESPQFAVAGPSLVAYDKGAVIVIDRQGHIKGRGVSTKPAALSYYPGIYVAPTGTRWAWVNTDVQQAPDRPESDSLWLAGLGEAPHRLKTWTGDYSIWPLKWSDAGIVITRVASGCGGEPLSSVTVDPVSGLERPVFGKDVWPMDVHAGVFTVLSRTTTLVLGGVASGTRSYSLPIHKALVSPAGTEVEVTTMGEQGCGGVWKAATYVIDLASQRQTVLPGFYADEWLDESTLIGRTIGDAQRGGWSAHAQVAATSGQVTELALCSRIVGVLR